jgi:septin family protein
VQKIKESIELAHDDINILTYSILHSYFLYYYCRNHFEERKKETMKFAGVSKKLVAFTCLLFTSSVCATEGMGGLRAVVPPTEAEDTAGKEEALSKTIQSHRKMPQNEESFQDLEDKLHEDEANLAEALQELEEDMEEALQEDEEVEKVVGGRGGASTAAQGQQGNGQADDSVFTAADVSAAVRKSHCIFA